MVTPAHVPPGPLMVEVLEEFGTRERLDAVEDVTDLMVLRLFAIHEIDGPASTNGFVFDIDQRY